MPYGNLNVDTVTTSTAGGVLGAGNASIMKNRIINGAMVVAQRGTSAVTTDDSYPVDRFYVIDNTTTWSAIQSSTAPTGFNYSIAFTNGTGASPTAAQRSQIRTTIEGYNMADWGWGTANAKTVTLSFWVRSSLTGSFGGAVRNDGGDRCYPFSYTISAANTWEQKSVTITGCTDGTWLSTNGRGLMLGFDLGSGSNFAGTVNTWETSQKMYPTGSVQLVATTGATFYVTGVQLEVGSNATGFEYVNYQTSLANCQRYYEKSYDMSSVAGAITTTGCMSSSRQNGQYGNQIQFRVSKRATPTVTVYSTSSGQSGYIFNDNQSNSLVATTIRVGENAFVTGAGSSALGEAQAFHYTASAEL